METRTMMELKALHQTYKDKADFQVSMWGPDCQEAKMLDDLARDIDMQILELMIEGQEASVTSSVID